jgi:hypothetical protein
LLERTRLALLERTRLALLERTRLAALERTRLARFERTLLRSLGALLLGRHNHGDVARLAGGAAHADDQLCQGLLGVPALHDALHLLLHGCRGGGRPGRRRCR